MNGASPAYPFLASPLAPDELGRFGPYRVLRLLGEGGMGWLFAAEDMQLHRLVALKVAKPSVAARLTTDPTAAEEERRRFLREARGMAALRHEHIATIYHVDTVGDVPFFTMEYLEGESLESRLHRLPGLSQAEILRIAIEVVEGVAAAHARGVLHRDIKPTNVWLEAPAARVKLLDFGLARLTSDPGKQTPTGLVVGTPGYLAPEQARGLTASVRSDLFSVGVLLYRAMTNRMPFTGATALDLLVNVVTLPPHPFTAADEPWPAALRSLVMRLLEKRPEDRPASAAEVLTTLRTIAVEQGMSRPETMPQPPEVAATNGHTSTLPWPADQQVTRWQAPTEPPPPATPRWTTLILMALAVGLAVASVIRHHMKPPTPAVLEVRCDVPSAWLTITDAAGRARGCRVADREAVVLEPGTYWLDINPADHLQLDRQQVLVAPGERQPIHIRKQE